MKSPGIVIPGAMTAIRSLNEAVQQGGVPQRTLDLVHLRTSQINGCSVCLGAAVKAREDGEADERLFTLPAWRDTPYFSDAERAALASPKPSPGSATGPIPYLTTSGTRPPGTTTRSSSPRWSCGSPP
jgi:AhpD family alkylhydroperoxidase